uniref:Putative secreted protein n=1 Tax=Ixodes ricinus TaxID=34613 RepID=A0A6B0UH70_IXORI
MATLSAGGVTVFNVHVLCLPLAGCAVETKLLWHQSYVFRHMITFPRIPTHKKRGQLMKGRDSSLVSRARSLIPPHCQLTGERSILLSRQYITKLMGIGNNFAISAISL